MMVYKLKGKNAGRVGIISGTLESRAASGITKCTVKFPQIAFPGDLLVNVPTSQLVEANVLQIAMDQPEQST